MPNTSRARAPLTMDDAHYITALMRRDTDALGFIPAPALHDRILRHGRYLIQHDAQGNRRGYLLHGPPIAGKPLRVYQVCVDLDHRRILYATRMVRQLIERARRAGATDILLRCATDLDANAFWRAVGAQPVGLVQGGQRRRRWITLYSLPVPPRRSLRRNRARSAHATPWMPPPQ